MITWQTTGVQTIEYPYAVNIRESQAMDSLVCLPRMKGIADVLIIGNHQIDTVVMNHQNYGSLILKYGEFYDYIFENYPEYFL